MRSLTLGQQQQFLAANTQQLLVEKIVKLQRVCARTWRQEKLDLLEEPVEQLMNGI